MPHECLKILDVKYHLHSLGMRKINEFTVQSRAENTKVQIKLSHWCTLMVVIEIMSGGLSAL